MELLLRDGEYVSAEGDGALAHVSGTDETAQRIMMKLRARRGGFPLRPDFGSRLFLLHREKPSAMQSAARRYVAEALAGENVDIENIELSRDGDEIEIRLWLTAGAQKLTLTTAV